ncbi:hypothetical protein NM688_g9238 [Phlebia brevispora]|uniref:Uncharacterized protein n=1 Tax=Phlebia brevispora TaxID=194682 RepID=A0ACC1RIJ7_9APHY|nr:hypothetical protein NM688_g9238 [Phlebia brevispora]
MAYNREWDRGKDNWNDPSWSEYQDKGNVRGREDDYYGEGKRRKFNNGGYNASQGWDEGNYNNFNQGRPNAQWQQQEHTDDRQHWNAYGKKRQVPSEPSPHVIFLGLDPDFTEADLQAFLTNQNRTVETVTIIRDRSTGTYLPLRSLVCTMR